MDLELLRRIFLYSQLGAQYRLHTHITAKVFTVVPVAEGDIGTEGRILEGLGRPGGGRWTAFRLDCQHETLCHEDMEYPIHRRRVLLTQLTGNK